MTQLNFFMFSRNISSFIKGCLLLSGTFTHIAFREENPDLGPKPTGLGCVREERCEMKNRIAKRTNEKEFLVREANNLRIALHGLFKVHAFEPMLNINLRLEMYRRFDELTQPLPNSTE